jgi:adenine-specific DNA methylase
VCDPFLGGGTTAVVAARYGCPVIGAELDPVAHATTLVRVKPEAT